MTFDEFALRWAHSGEAERANKDSFLNELCDVLGVEHPHPKVNDPERDSYVFEKDVPRTKGGAVTIGRIDLYKRRAIWNDSLSLDPARRSAKVTRDVAEQIAALAKALESGGEDPQLVATFLMRCLFTMFAEDVGLLPERLFSKALEEWWIPSPEAF